MRGGARAEKTRFFIKIFEKVPKNAFFGLFSKICLRRTNFSQNRVFLLLWESSENQFCRLIKKEILLKIRPPRENPRSAQENPRSAPPRENPRSAPPRENPRSAQENLRSAPPRENPRSAPPRENPRSAPLEKILDPPPLEKILDPPPLEKTLDPPPLEKILDPPPRENPRSAPPPPSRKS